MRLEGSKGGADHVTVAVVAVMDTICSETGEPGRATCMHMCECVHVCVGMCVCDCVCMMVAIILIIL
jgi:hypothetical protein